MKKTILLICLMTFICSFLGLNEARAMHLLGTEISWSCVGRDSFMVKLAVFRDCNYIYLSTMPLIAKCIPTNSTIVAKSMSVPTPLDITPTCGSSCTRCANSGCSFPYGVEQYNFTCLMVLSNSGSCCEVRLEFSMSCRNNGITTGAADKNFFNKAILNRCITPCDNSPFFTNPPIEIACAEQNFVFNNGVQDIDTTPTGGLMDSLTYEWTSPLETLGSPIGYNSGYSFDKPLYFYAFPNAQITFPRGFHLNPSSGDISFRPMRTESTVMVLKVNEFRNGVKIGEINRDIVLLVISCPSNISPTLGSNSFYKEVCAGNPVTFNITTNDLNPNDSLIISWNNGIPGGSWSDNNGTTRHPSGIFTWTPSENKASDQLYQFTVTVKDHACPVMGSCTQAFRILVKHNGKASYSVADSSCGLYYFKAVGLPNYQPDTFTWNSPQINFPSYNSAVASEKLHPGIYPYSLKSSYKGCFKMYYDTLTVDNKFAVARLSVNKYSQCLRANSFIFYDSSYIGQGTITGRTIYFGDGQWSVQKCDTHFYLQAGNYRVKLVVTDSNGCIDSAIQNINVLQHPEAGFQINLEKQCLDGNYFDFKDSTIVSGIPINEYGWNSGDLSVFKIKDIAHLYSAPGTYQVKHWAVNDSGCADTISKIVVVYPMPVASFSVNDSGQCLDGNYFIFTNHSTISSGSTTAFWEMGDGSGSSSNYHSAYSYSSDGIYQVRLIMASANGCTDSAYRNIYVFAVPTASFSIPDSSQCLKHNLFSFINLSSGSVSSRWDMGDGLGGSSDTDTSYSYLSDGKYQVKLTVTSVKGCLDSVSQSLSVHPMPQADFVVNDINQCQNGNLFIFTNKSSLKYGIYSGSWDFGDYTYDTVFSPSHSYPSAGNYTIKLVTQSDQGCTDNIVKNIIVRPNPETYLGIDTTIFDNQSITLDAGTGFDSYLWSNLITSRKITVDTSGASLGSNIFWVRIMKDSCVGYDTILITFIHHVSIYDPENNQVITVYPNPVSTELNITLNGFTDDVNLALTDVFGKQLKSWTILGVNSHDTLKLNISDLTRGIYFLDIFTGEKRIFIKLVKN